MRIRAFKQLHVAYGSILVSSYFVITKALISCTPRGPPPPDHPSSSRESLSGEAQDIFYHCSDGDFCCEFDQCCDCCEEENECCKIEADDFFDIISLWYFWFCVFVAILICGIGGSAYYRKKQLLAARSRVRPAAADDSRVEYNRRRPTTTEEGATQSTPSQPPPPPPPPPPPYFYRFPPPPYSEEPEGVITVYPAMPPPYSTVAEAPQPTAPV